jgi:uncharacterized protein YeaO (DUF488 family)
VIRTKRAYEPASSEDGYRVLVDRLWPRGVSKEDARLDAWMKEVAPSDDLREWFDHDPERWEEFTERYRQELRERAGEETITLVFAARDTDRNNAVVLKEYLEEIPRHG